MWETKLQRVVFSFDQNILTNKLDYKVNINFKSKQLKFLFIKILINRNIFDNQFQNNNF